MAPDILDLELVVRSREPLTVARVVAAGLGAVKVSGLPPVVLSDARREIDVPLAPLAHLTGRRGVEEWLYRQRIAVEGTVAIEVVR